MYGKVGDTVSFVPFFWILGSLLVGYLWAKGTNLTKGIIVSIVVAVAAYIAFDIYTKDKAKEHQTTDTVSVQKVEQKGDVKKTKK